MTNSIELLQLNAAERWHREGLLREHIKSAALELVAQAPKSTPHQLAAGLRTLFPAVNGTLLWYAALGAYYGGDWGAFDAL